MEHYPTYIYCIVKIQWWVGITRAPGVLGTSGWEFWLWLCFHTWAILKLILYLVWNVVSLQSLELVDVLDWICMRGSALSSVCLDCVSVYHRPYLKLFLAGCGWLNNVWLGHSWFLMIASLGWVRVCISYMIVVGVRIVIFWFTGLFAESSWSEILGLSLNKKTRY